MKEYKIIAEKDGKKETINYCYGKESAKEKKKHLEHQHPEAEFKIELRHKETNRMY